MFTTMAIFTVNIAVANEYSHLVDRFGVNVWDIEITNWHSKVEILRPGPGVGILLQRGSLFLCEIHTG
jgi:UDP-N-acetyl-D-mannosaminuronate dehydrogenase